MLEVLFGNFNRLYQEQFLLELCLQNFLLALLDFTCFFLASKFIFVNFVIAIKPVVSTILFLISVVFVFRPALVATIIHKISERRSTFYVKQHTTGKVQFLFFRRFLRVPAKFLFWEEGLALGDNSMKFSHFLDIF